MKLAILTTATDAAKLQEADDVAAKLPWKGVYIDGTPCPPDQGITRHLYDVQAHPKESLYAYPVDEKSIAEAKPGDPIKSAVIVDRLDATWAVAEAPKEEPIEEPKEEPIQDDYAVLK